VLCARIDPVLLEVRDLKTHFELTGGILRRATGTIHAVDGISFSVREGEIVGLVGESGCGKSTVGKTILGITPHTEGTIAFEAKDLFTKDREEALWFKRNIQMVFQNPQSSLDPRMTVGSIIGEPIRIHHRMPKKEIQERVLELLNVIGLQAHYVNRYPHEFSGGQRQRIGIARALALNPKFIILDEPTSALDVSVQAQILNLLQDLREMHHLTYLFISHDLSVIEHISDRVIVMYLGKILESASREDLFKRPFHPYTKALLAAIPVPDPKYRGFDMILGGIVPSATSPPLGCRFCTRCPSKIGRLCEETEPQQTEIDKDHFVACHLTQAS
jgi:oligopeptide/dipeptide ABC transporter ATP-binding protein